MLETLGRAEGELRFDRPKSTPSWRPLTLPTPSVLALRSHLTFQATERRLAGDRWREHGEVEDGGGPLARTGSDASGGWGVIRVGSRYASAP